MTESLAILFIAGLLISIVNWRKGMLLTVAVGFLMDPLRKVIEGQPVYFVVGVGVFTLATIVGYYLKHGRFRLHHLGELRKVMKTPMTLLLLLLAYQSIVSIMKYQSPVLVGIGLLSYLAPIPGFLIAFYYGLQTKNIIRLIKFYVIISMLMISGIYFSYFGYEWDVLKEVGSGVVIYTSSGILKSFPGFLRSTEIAAWHSAATISFILILSISGKLAWPKIFVAAAILALIFAGLLTGRRKMLVEVVIFISIFGVLLWWFRHGASRLVLIGIVITGLVGLIGVTKLTESEQASNIQVDRYMDRGSSVFGDVEERFSVFGLGTVNWAINRFGYLGGGLGVASQGAQNFGAGGQRFGGAGEGGLGKIVAELGIPGLILIAWITWVMMSYFWRLIRDLSRYNSPMVKIFYGLLAFLLSNIPVFIVATQVFGDLFVLLILGWVFGFVVAIGQVLRSSEQAQSEVPQVASHRRRMVTE